MYSMEPTSLRSPGVLLIVLGIVGLTSCTGDHSLASKSATLDTFLTNVSEAHHRYCGSDRVCQAYRPSRCYSCEPCQCDVSCHQYGDCCPDVTATSQDDVDRSVVVPNNQSCVAELFDQSTLSVRLAETTEVKRYFMVTHCPDPSFAFAAQCQNMMTLPPVTSSTNGTTYRNAFCAHCNGVTAFRTWRVKVDCVEHQNFLTLPSMEAVIRAALNDTACMVYYAPPDDIKPRRCYHDDSLITSCNVTGEWLEYDSFVERACATYTTVKDIDGVLYRNVFCYICNSAAPSLFERCKRGKHGQPMSFSALLDFLGPETSQTNPTDRCQDDAIFDPDRDLCRKILCERGKQFAEGECIPIFPISKGIGYELYFRLVFNLPLPLFGNEDALRIVSNSLEGYFMYQVLDGNVLFHNVVVASNTSLQADGTCAAETRDLSMYITMMTVQPVNQTEFEAKLLELRAERTYTLWIDGANMSFTTFRDKTAQALRRAPTTSLSQSGSCRMAFERALSQGNQSEAANDLVFIRVSNLLTCPQVRLFEDEFSLSRENYTLSVAWLEDLLNETDYEVDDDQSVRICLRHFRPERLSAALHRESRSQAEVIVSMVCTGASLFFLALTFATYCALKSLRSLPGKNNMNLTFTLFCAQLLYVTGSGRTEVRGVCEAMGILIHYWWLAAFCAMNVCAWHMFRVFGAMRQRQEEGESRRRFLQYSVYIYGLPVLVVLVTLIAHIVATDGGAIGYGGRVCYLSSVVAIGLAFALPVALIVVVNIVFFFVTVRAIRRSPKLDKSRQDECHAVVYVKLSSLTGLTWTLGFVSMITRVPALTYIFIVVNASQGVFIFFSFIWNTRVRKLLVACTHARRGSSTGTSGSSSNTTKLTTQGTAHTVKA